VFGDYIGDLDNAQHPVTTQELNELYALAFHLHSRKNRLLDLFALLESTDRRTDISQNLDEFRARNTWNTNDMRNLNSADLLDICNMDSTRMGQLMAQLRAVIPVIDAVPDYEDVAPPYSPPPQYALPQVSQNPFWEGAQIKNAKELLDSAFQQSENFAMITTEYTWGYQLRAFFESPDIWPPGVAGIRLTPKFNYIVIFLFVNKILKNLIL
jgi:hypothetical protein